MRVIAAVAACAALAHAQDFDWDAILGADTVPTASIPVVYVTAAGASTTASATTASYEASSIIASISSDIASGDVASASSVLGSAATSSPALEKRAATTCVQQPAGVAVHPTPDTASAFAGLEYFSSVASAAPTPTGYSQTFSNLNGSTLAGNFYLGYTLMEIYDTQACSAKCNAINGCMAVNIYFERDPSVDPNDSSCSNPSSTTQIKCVFWGGPVDSSTANNYGQWRNQFQVVIAGSNGYVNNTIVPAAGYKTAQNLGSATINAPLDCSSSDTYMGMRLFTDGVFDANKCAALCSATSDFDRQHGFWQTCQFFTTYMLYKNSQPVGQYCAMYTKSWEASYAKNTGYWYGKDHYTIGYSYAYTNGTDAGSSRYACIDSSCNNAGVEWSYSNITADTQWTWSRADAGLDPVAYKTVKPVYKSTSDHVGGWWWSWNTTTTFYAGTSTPLNTNGAVLNHRGYFFAREAGSYTFTIPSTDDVAFVWVGEAAYSGYNEGNALVLSSFQNSSAVSATKYLSKGAYVPIRVIYGNQGGGPGSLYFEIKSPSGVVLLKSDGSASKYLVQKGCDASVAPAFAAFGAEP
ncbi:hypothetical protein AAFC00_000834 [Neodothiora populina]|uniref:PA14 domain-containing protein n=1 Tax=Neodothiora populina TaxID=2781224 RepID=A0ABR3PM09_9PEZI